MDHQVAPDLIVVVAQPVGVALGGREQQQPRGFDGVSGDGHGPGSLVVLATRPSVGDAGRGAGAVIDHDAGDHGVGPDLGAVGQRVGHVGDQRAGLRVDLAPLQAEAPVDAVRPIPEAPVGDRDRPDPGLDACGLSAAHEDVAIAADRVRMMGVGVGVAPRPVLSGDGQFLFEQFVERFEVVVTDRPVCAHSVMGEGREVRRV